MKLNEWLTRENTVNRCTGRTVRMVKSLPRGQRGLVIVYKNYMVSVIEDLIKAYNPTATPAIIVASSPEEAKKKIAGDKYDYITVEHYCAEKWVTDAFAPLYAFAENVEF